jgi:hypothetical protein
VDVHKPFQEKMEARYYVHMLLREVAGPMLWLMGRKRWKRKQSSTYAQHVEWNVMKVGDVNSMMLLCI